MNPPIIKKKNPPIIKSIYIYLCTLFKKKTKEEKKKILIITMANGRRLLLAKANDSKVGSLILMAVVFGSCLANGEYLGGGRGLSGSSGAVFDITKFGAVGDGATNTFKVRCLKI